VKPHECNDRWRLILADMCWDRDAHDIVADELGDCAWCWKQLAHTAIHLFGNLLALQAQSLEEAAQVAQDEVERLIG
jgi:hypothetical protein